MHENSDDSDNYGGSEPDGRTRDRFEEERVLRRLERVIRENKRLRNQVRRARHQARRRMRVRRPPNREH